MIFNDIYAYIPLFSITATAAVVFILLLAIRKKSTARVSFIALLSTILVAAGSFIAAVHSLGNESADDSLMVFATFCLAAFIIVIPYCIILCTFEPKKIDKLVPHSLNVAAKKAEVAQAEEPQKHTEATQEDVKILDISRIFMAKATEAVSSENGMNSLLDYVNETIRKDIKADGGAILLVDDFDDIITVKSFDGDFPPPYKLPNDMPHKPIRVATNFKFASFPLRDNIFGEIAISGKPELITKPELDDRIYQNGPEEFLEIGSYIIVPMKIQDTVIGVAAFSRNHGNTLFTEDDLKAATTIADFAAAAIKSVVSVKDVIEHNSLINEANTASSIQNLLHPAKLPVISGMQIGTIWNPSEGVCGDYYDIIPSRKDRVSFVMSDIAGKGINSVIVMSMLRAMIRLVVNTKQSAGTILEWVNHGIAGESFSTDHFASCALINYNPVSHSFEFATGGTTPIFYYDSASAKFTKLSHSSEPIGVDKTSQYKNTIQNVKSGDILVTYTDGLVEALNEQGQQYTKESLLRVITEHHASSAKDIANLVKADIKKFSGTVSQHDDQSLLVIKF